MSMAHPFHRWSASVVVLIAAAVVNQVCGQEKPLAEALASRVDTFGDPLPDGAFARLGTVRFRQGDIINTVAISPDGKTIASAGYPRTIHLWDTATGKRLHRLEGSESWIHSLIFLPDGKTLVSAGDAQSILFWDTATGKLIRRLDNPCSYVAIAPDGKTMASADHRSVIRILDVASGKQLHQLQGLKGEIYAIAFSPDGATLAWGGGNDGKSIDLHLANVQTGKELRRCQAEGRHVRSLSFSPDGKTLASAGNKQPIRLWEVATGKVVRQIGKEEEYLGAILFAPDGKMLISGHQDGSIAVWETASGKERRRWPADHSSILHLALASDGRTLVAGGHAGLVCLWDMNTGKKLAAAPGKQSAIERWAFTADGKTVVTLCRDGTLRHWNAATGHEVRDLPGPRGWVRASFAPGGRELATLGEDGIVRFRQTDTGKEVWQLSVRKDMYYGLGFSPTDNILISGVWDTSLRLLDGATGKEKLRLDDGDRRFQTATFSPDAKVLITSHHQPIGLDEAISSTIRIPPVGRINFWKVSTGKKIHSIDGTWEHGLQVSVSQDGKMLAVPNTDGSVSLWEMATKRERLRSPQPDATSKQRCGAPTFLTFSPNGRLLYMGQANNRLLVLETATGKAPPPVVVHDGPVRDVGFAPDGKTLAVLGSDGTILLWDAMRLSRRPAAAATKLSARELESLWVDLAAEDAPLAWKAIGTLASAPEPAIALLNERLTPAPPPDAQRLKQMIAELGSNDFQQRAKAMRDVESLGDAAEPALRQTLQGNPPLESRRRIEAVLAKVESQILTRDALRHVRAVEALETIGTPEARQVLTGLAKGSPAAHLTREVQASLKRLAGRTITAP